MGRKQEKGHKQKKTAKAEAEDENTLSKKDKKIEEGCPDPSILLLQIHYVTAPGIFKPTDC